MENLLVKDWNASKGILMMIIKEGKWNVEFANISGGIEGFDDIDSLRDRGLMEAKSWWLIHGAHAPTLQNIALKLLGQPCSSSCFERN